MIWIMLNFIGASYQAGFLVFDGFFYDALIMSDLFVG